MPLQHHQHINPTGELGIWQIVETEAWFREQLLLSPAELRQLSTIKGRRRLEFLAARQLVHQMSRRTVRGAFVKDEFGKPHLSGSNWHISISHSHSLAAAVASPLLCGIDIQFIVPKITRLAHKFLRAEEAASITEKYELDQLHFYWGAKEALYKAYGRRELDFKKHLHVEPIAVDIPTGRTTARILKDGVIDQSFQVYYQRSETGYMLVWCVALQEAM